MQFLQIELGQLNENNDSREIKNGDRVSETYTDTLPGPN